MKRVSGNAIKINLIFFGDTQTKSNQSERQLLSVPLVYASRQGQQTA